ncbi:hypothetical protein LMG918_09215 [Xanthomonas euvesicatoria]|nr:hypothetical protein LMG918_09215 [Xanthomonas euvesicatoria]PWH22823.1 hypothetical protein CDO09_15940 [Xanthomonas perforans]
MLKHVARIWMLAVFGQNVPSQVRGDAESCRAICLICPFRTMRDAMGVSPPQMDELPMPLSSSQAHRKCLGCGK